MSLDKELAFLVWQFLNEEKYTEAAHRLEKESGIYFNLKYFEELLLDGKFDEAESYLSGFTKLEDNKHSTKIFFEIRKQKYLEALDRKDRSKAVQILNNDLRVFRDINPGVYRQITELVILDDFRENEQLRNYSNTQSQRISMFRDIEKIAQNNPVIRPKLRLPSIRTCRLRSLINQSVSWQHMLCKTPQPDAEVKTLFVDHVCAPSTGALTPAPVNNTHVGSSHNGGTFRPIAMQATFQPQVGPASHSLPARLANYRPPVQQGFFLQRPRTASASNGGTVCQLTDAQADEIKQLEVTCPHDKYSENDLPKIVGRTINHGSNVVSLDFHPQQQTIILVGTDVGDIAIWEVGSSEKLTHKTFKDWVASNRAVAVQVALSESAVSVNRCVWSPDGAFVGVAFSKDIVHIYHYVAGELTQHLEIDAHIGGVNDIAFVYIQRKLCLISCGDDKIIKVWDGEIGCKLYTFEGHEAPVYSVCPHHKGNIQFIYSIDVGGRIKAWVYDPPSCRVDYDAPGHGCTSMAYSVDGSRFFTCGTSKEGESYLVECEDCDGTIKRSYSGLERQSSELVKFATIKNRFLAAGDQFQIKFWDMDNINILSTTDAEGCLQARPYLCFNKMGSLLAVTTRDNRIKILANADGVELLRMLESRRLTPESKDSLPNLIGAAYTTGPVLGKTGNSEIIPPVSSMNGVARTSMVDVKRRVKGEGKGESGSMNWKFAEVTDPVHCRSIKLTDPLPTGKIVRLLYAHSCPSLFALDSNGAHKQWLWQRNVQNPSGKVNPNVQPQFLQPTGDTIMKNDTSDRGLEEVVPCIALSKNDSYLISASGGKVSLFNTITFKLMKDYMPPPPAATCLAFHPLDNNIIAIGMEDSIIQIFNIQLTKVTTKLEGHQKRITGLAFSKALNALVSSGADAQLCVWNINGWEKCKSKAIQSPAGSLPSPLTDTTIQFNSVNQVQLLVVQESQIAIYDASELEYVCHWAPRDPMPARISSATYSCDGLLVYASFFDGSIGVFDSEVLRPRCRIAPSAFIPDMGSGNTYPLVITANPYEPNQIAVGLTDGSIHVIEPAP